MNLRDRIPGLAQLSDKIFGLARQRTLPVWHRDIFRPSPSRNPNGREIVLLADTFNTYFEPENLRAASRVLEAAGYRVHHAQPVDGSRRPLCCGRTFLAVGLVEDARREVRRLSAALLPYVRRGVPVIGLEPSCLLTLRDELGALLPGEDSEDIATHALLFEEFLAREEEAGRLSLQLRAIGAHAHLHGHCHQKSFGAMGAVEKVLRLIPGLEVQTIASSCCGMAGAFGYQSETFETSLKMAELSLFPALRKIDPDSFIVADGTSCRQQIEHGIGRAPQHVAVLLDQALSPAPTRNEDDDNRLRQRDDPAPIPA